MWVLSEEGKQLVNLDRVVEIECVGDCLRAYTAERHAILLARGARAQDLYLAILRNLYLIKYGPRDQVVLAPGLAAHAGLQVALDKKEPA